MLPFALRYYWRAARGHRLRPWRSPFLCWRMETFFGVHGEQLNRQEFFRLLWRERRRLLRFFRWAEELEARQRTPQSRFDPGQGAA